MISTLWGIRTEVLMLEECLSAILIAPLTGEVKDVGVNEVVGLASDDETEVVENASDDCCFHGINPFFPWRSSLGVMPLRAWRYHIGGNRPLRFSSGLGTGNGRITVAWLYF